jgi:hypothetical protein
LVEARRKRSVGDMSGKPPASPPGIDAQRALDVAARVAELGSAREELRLHAIMTPDEVIEACCFDLMAKLKLEMEALRADPCGVLGRARTR